MERPTQLGKSVVLFNEPKVSMLAQPTTVLILMCSPRLFSRSWSFRDITNRQPTKGVWTAASHLTHTVATLSVMRGQTGVCIATLGALPRGTENWCTTVPCLFRGSSSSNNKQSTANPRSPLFLCHRKLASSRSPTGRRLALPT